MGLRSLVETSQVDFIGAVEQAGPSFSGPDGKCPLLAQYPGGEEGSREAAGHTGEGRGRVLLESGEAGGGGGPHRRGEGESITGEWGGWGRSLGGRGQS